MIDFINNHYVKNTEIKQNNNIENNENHNFNYLDLINNIDKKNNENISNFSKKRSWKAINNHSSEKITDTPPNESDETISCDSEEFFYESDEILSCDSKGFYQINKKLKENKDKQTNKLIKNTDSHVLNKPIFFKINRQKKNNVNIEKISNYLPTDEIKFITEILSLMTKKEKSKILKFTDAVEIIMRIGKKEMREIYGLKIFPQEKQELTIKLLGNKKINELITKIIKENKKIK